MSNITIYQHIPPQFLPANPTKDESSRLTKYAAWVHDNGYSWVSPNLRLYRDYLLTKDKPLSARSVESHLSTVRQALRRIADDRDYLYAVAAELSPDTPKIALKPIVDEFTVRIEIAMRNAKVKTQKVQDESDSAYVRLTPKQANELIQLPDRTKLAGLRDAALIGLALATGLRADELLSLKIDDLYHKLGGKDAIFVREGKGRKQRLVPYGAHSTVLQLVHKWMNVAGVKSGFVFRAVTRSGKLHGKSLTVRAFEYRLNLYTVDGLIVTPHDLRRTYAKQQYLNGMDIVAIRDNLGHESIETTLIYIGEQNAEKRVPSQGYHYL